MPDLTSKQQKTPGYLIASRLKGRKMTRSIASDDLDVLSAIWILASNDENPLITYQGLRFRLDLPVDYEVRECIRKHPEAPDLVAVLAAVETLRRQSRLKQ